MRAAIILAAIAAASSTAAAGGEIYRCVGADGAVTFTNVACPANTNVHRIASYEPEPEPAAPAYDARAEAAEASAREARDAAEQARAAAYQAQATAWQQAQAAYEQGQAEARAEAQQSTPDNSLGWVPYYPAFSAPHRGHHRQGHTPQVVKWTGQAPPPEAWFGQGNNPSRGH